MSMKKIIKYLQHVIHRSKNLTTGYPMVTFSKMVTEIILFFLQLQEECLINGE